MIARERILLFETLILSCDQPPYSIWDTSKGRPFLFVIRYMSCISLLAR